MGQPITAIATTSSRPGTIRFEINRTLTGMGHERYLTGTPVEGDRPPDRLARDLLECDGVKAVHIYANLITVEVDDGVDLDVLNAVIEDLYTYYRPGVEVPSIEGAAAED